MIKFLSKTSQSITGAALVISAASFVSMLVGLLRERTFSTVLGAGLIKDAYQTAFIVPDLLYNLLIIGALTAGFVPLFTRLYTSDKPERAWRLANNILNICVGALIIICVTGMIFAHPLAHLIAFKSSAEKQELIGNFLRIILLSPIFLGISMIVGGILQSLRQFLLYAIAPIFYNLGIITGAVGLMHIFGIMGLAWGVVLGAFLHMSIQLYGAIHNGFRWRWVMDFKDKESRELGRLMIPRTLGLAFTQMSLAVITILSNMLPSDGNVSVLGYAVNLQGVPISLIGASFALAVFPVLASAAAQKNMEEFKTHLSTTLRQIIFLIIPIAALFLILRIQMVRVIYGAGKFDWNSTVMTANALACLSLGIVMESILPLLARAFYALSDTKTPFIMGAISELTTIISAILLMYPSFHALDYLGIDRVVAGLAFTSSLGATINVILLLIFLKKKIHDFDSKKLWMLLLRVSLATLVMGLVTQFLKTPVSYIVDMSKGWGILLQGLISGIVGILVYLGLCWVFKVEELHQVFASMKKRWLKIVNRGATIDEGQNL